MQKHVRTHSSATTGAGGGASGTEVSLSALGAAGGTALVEIASVRPLLAGRMTDAMRSMPSVYLAGDGSPLPGAGGHVCERERWVLCVEKAPMARWERERERDGRTDGRTQSGGGREGGRGREGDGQTDRHTHAHTDTDTDTDTHTHTHTHIPAAGGGEGFECTRTGDRC